MFSFHTDDESRDYCEKIIKAMELLYDIDPVTGLEILNDFWFGFDWREGSETANHTYVLYHQTHREWADIIGNPCPAMGTELELKQWRARQGEAERRIAAFRKAGQFEWLRDDWRF